MSIVFKNRVSLFDRLKYVWCFVHQIDLLGQDFYTKVAPGCMSCLESFEVFLRKKHHIKVVEHILKVATALKELKVNLYPMIIQHERAVYQRLLDFPRSSPICQVKVVHLY